MIILLTGATGLVGKELGKALIKEGHELVVLSQDSTKAPFYLPFPAKVFPWGANFEELPTEILNGVEAIIHLAGESIGNGRWTKKRKQKIYESRILTTRKLVNAVKATHLNGNLQLKHFISASAIGIYGNRGEEEVNEESSLGTDYLATVCKDWEKETQDLSELGIRVVNPRIGIVLSAQGGALEKMLLPFGLGFGGVIGLGRQWMSWIHLEDLVQFFLFTLNNHEIKGCLNAVAPGPVTNKEFSKTLASSLEKPLLFPIPPLMLKVMLGEMSTLILSGQKVSSAKAQKKGMKFKYPDLQSALKEICHPFQNSQKELLAEQWVPKKPEDIFPFFSDEKNLEKLTPEFLGFKVLQKSTPHIHEGTLIDYRLSVHGIPLRWRTRIEDWKPGHQFVDTQLKGPYQLWHHTHDFIEFAGGTLMRDRVLYRVPFGWLGDLFAGIKVRSDVTKIFNFRRKIIFDLFYRS